MTDAQAIVALLGQRASGASICPSEAARLLAGPQGDWHAQMDAVHAAAGALLASGTIGLSWQGETKEKRRGPYRIARH